MSKYTTEVRYICEDAAGLSESVGYLDVDEVISKSRTKIFDFNYPIFEEDYRETLETKILMHYYTREIGFETVGLWKHFLKMRMNEIMPYYNKLYEAELIFPDNPFNDTDYTREGERHDTGSGNESTEGSNTGVGTNKMTGTVSDVGTNSSEDGGSDSVVTDNSKSRANEPRKDTWTLYSDTPQGGVAGINAAEASVGSNAYLTNATHVIENGVGSSETEDIDETKTTNYGKTVEGSNNNTRTYNTTNTINSRTDLESETNKQTQNDGEYAERVHGKIGKTSYVKLFKELKDNFVNIDVLVIRDLGDLFMNVY